MKKINLKKGQHLAPHTRVEIVRALIAAMVEQSGALASDLLYNLKGGGQADAVWSLRATMQVRIRPVREALIASGDWLANCGVCDNVLTTGELVIPYGDNRYDCVGCNPGNGKGYAVYYYNAKGADYSIRSFAGRVRDRENSEALATPYTGGPGTL